MDTQTHVFRRGVCLLREHSAILEGSGSTGQDQRVRVELNTCGQLHKAAFVRQGEQAHVVDKRLAM